MPQIPADAVNRIFVLYDPIDDDHREEVVLERVILQYDVYQVGTTSTDGIGLGVYLARRNAAGAMVSDIDPLGFTRFDIESNNQLWRATHNFRPNDADGQPQSYRSPQINIKAKRKIEDPAFLVMVIRVDAANSALQFTFNARALMKEGRF